VAYHTTIEFEQEPENWSTFAEAIDNAMRKQNIYYDDLIVGNILKKSSYYGCKNGFQDYMKSIGN
jgi:enolase